MRRKPRRRIGLFILPLFLLGTLFAARWRMLNPPRSQSEVWLGQQAQNAVEMNIIEYYSVPIYRGEKAYHASTTNRQDIQNMLSLLKCSGALSGQKNIPQSYGLADYGRFFSISLRRRDGRTVYLTLCPGSRHRASYDLVHFGSPSTETQFLGATHVNSVSYRAFSDAFETLWSKTGKKSS